MPTLKDTIVADQIQTMKNRDKDRLLVLRTLLSDIKNEEISKRENLSDEAVQSIVARQVKQLSEANKDFLKGGRDDLVAKNQIEIDILQTYLPKQINEEELEKIIKGILKDNDLTTSNQIGQAMGLIMKEVKGKADGNLVKKIVNKLLTN